MLFSCYHQVIPDQDLPNVYPSVGKRRASQGMAVGSIAASQAVLPREAEDFEVVVGDALVDWSVGAVSHRQPRDADRNATACRW